MEIRIRPNNNSLSEISRRRPRRRAKQQVYSDRYRQKLAAANYPDRDDIAAAVLRTMMPIWAKNWQWWHERYFPRLWDDLGAKGFDCDAAAVKVQAMMHAYLNRIERQGRRDGA